MTGIWTRADLLLLASASPTRRLLLEGAGFTIETCTPDVDERAIEAGGHDGPASLALTLARAKARDVSRKRPDRLVVGADQVLSCEGTLLHKPVDLVQAREQIAMLSGRTHSLHAAVAIAEGGEVVDGFVEEARLTMRRLDGPGIARYVDHAGLARVTASVGGYQLEGLGVHLFDAIEGDHSTILGLPLLPLLNRLRLRGCLSF